MNNFITPLALHSNFKKKLKMKVEKKQTSKSKIEQLFALDDIDANILMPIILYYRFDRSFMYDVTNILIYSLKGIPSEYDSNNIQYEFNFLMDQVSTLQDVTIFIVNI
jgi:hypothetical protein